MSINDDFEKIDRYLNQISNVVSEGNDFDTLAMELGNLTESIIAELSEASSETFNYFAQQPFYKDMRLITI